MTLRKLLGLLLVSFLVSGAARAEDSCSECKSAAVAAASQCRAQAAPDSALLATCDKNFAEMNRVCQETACRAEVGAQGAAQCSECGKQAEAEVKKCASLPPEVRAACQARAAAAKKACEDKSCLAARPR